MLRNSGHSDDDNDNDNGDEDDEEDEEEDKLSEHLGQLCSDTELSTFSFLFSQELCASIDMHGSFCFYNQRWPEGKVFC